MAPFHYFGLHDPTVDYDAIPEKAGAMDDAAMELALQTAQRVDYVIDMVAKFGYSGDRMIALGFCATIEHAKFMADACNARGYRAAYLTGHDAPQLRQATMARLEQADDPLSIIFTVNE